MPNRMNVASTSRRVLSGFFIFVSLSMGLCLSSCGGGAQQTDNTTADTVSPSSPSNLTATAVSSTQIDLSWAASNDNVGVTNYFVSRDGTLIHVGNVTAYQNTGLDPATTYSYTVQAGDAAHNLSAPSNTATATTTPAPAPRTPCG